MKGFNKCLHGHSVVLHGAHILQEVRDGELGGLAIDFHQVARTLQFARQNARGLQLFRRLLSIEAQQLLLKYSKRPYRPAALIFPFNEIQI